MTSSAPRFHRRRWLLKAGAASVAWAALTWGKKNLGPREPVFLAAGQRYDGALTQTIEEGLRTVGLNMQELRGKRVLLKPNLVEPSRGSPQMTTHPAVICAAAEVFRRHGATVQVGEGPGHVRDTEQFLSDSRVDQALHDADLEFVDLNYDEPRAVANRGRISPLKTLYFPRAIIEADLVVSLPKLKTHHWVGMTCALKNLYGIMPGLKYGWPKNALHYAGIPQTVFDINATVAKAITIVDGIECMEGDGPILGTSKKLGLLAVGLCPTAVDATCARLMGLDPRRISYLQLADGRLGPLVDWRIEQRGEPWQRLASPFAMLNEPHLQELRLDWTGPRTS